MFVRSALAVAALVLIASVPFSAVPAVQAIAPSVTPGYATYNGPAEQTFFPVDGCCLVLAGEPSIGVNWNTGKAFFQHGFDTYRVAFDDNTSTASWTEVTPPNSMFNVDPMLYTDSQTGRTYAGGLDGTCSVMAFTDDDGASWLPTGNMCVATLDHQTIVSGPWRVASGAPATVAPHTRGVYYCAQASLVTCITSYDGGITWATPSQVGCGFSNPGFHGSLHIGPKGDVYLPFRNCGGQIGMAVSQNNGMTWTAKPIPGTVTPAAGFDPDVATTKSGWVYIGFRNSTGGSFVSMTKNNGTSWTTPVNVGASLGIVSSTFHEMLAGDDDRAAVAFLGTTTPGDSFADGFTGVWHLYVSTTFDGGLTWTTQQASTDPVQRGWICAGGTGCTTGRNLLDFMDAQVDKEGRVLVGYVDGCVGVCAGPSGTAAQSTGATATITRQVAGNTLFAAYDGLLSGLRASAGSSYAGLAGAAIPLTGSASGGAGGYTYAWSVTGIPAGSAAGAASFSSTTAASPTFTPDIVGAYTLTLTVTDSASATASAVATLVATTTPGSGGPILTDPAGDNSLNLVVVTVNGGGPAGTDIRAVDIISETATEFTVELSVDDLAAATPTAVNILDIPTGADTIYTVSFQYAETPTNLVTYQVAASKYATGVSAEDTTFELEVAGAGTSGGFVTGIGSVSGEWDTAQGKIRWTVPKALMVVKTAPTGAADAGVLTGGVPPSTGAVLGGFKAEVRTWVFALVGVGPGATIWDTASGTGTYTFTA